MEFAICVCDFEISLFEFYALNVHLKFAIGEEVEKSVCLRLASRSLSYSALGMSWPP